MIDYKKVQKFASMLQASLGLTAENEKDEKVIDTKEVTDTDNAGNELDQRTDKEQAVTETPEPVLGEEEDKKETEIKAAEQKKEEAPKVTEEVKQEKKEDEAVAEEDEIEAEQDEEIAKKTAKIAKMQRLIKLAKVVKKSKKLSAEEKEEALENIKKSAKKMKEADGENKIIDKKSLKQEKNTDYIKKLRFISQHLMNMPKGSGERMLSNMKSPVNLQKPVGKLKFGQLVNLIYLQLMNQIDK